VLQRTTYLKLLKLPVKLFSYFLEQQSDAQEGIIIIWRKRIFTTIFLFAILMGSVTYISNTLFRIHSGQWFYVIVYTLGYLIAIIVTIVRAIPFNLRAWTGILLFYGLALPPLITYGPVASGRMFLFAFALLASLLLGLRAGIIALIINVSTFSIFSWLLSTGHLQWPHIIDYSLEKWLTSSYTFFYFNTIVTVSLGVLVGALEKNLRKEQSLTSELKLSNEQLERENVERRLAEKSLRKSRERFKTLTDNLHVGIYRNTTGPKGRFLEANPALWKMFDFESRNEFLKVNVSDLYQHADDRKRFNMKMLRDGFVRNEELRLRKKNGDNIICSVTAVAVKNEKGRVRYYDGAIEDVTEQKQMEAQFQQAQKMKAIGTLAGGVAHDLNNILSGVVSYPELILMDLPEGDPLREPIGVIQESGKKAAAIVQDLLTLARRGVSTSEVVNLNSIISEYLTSPEFKKLKAFHPTVEIDTDLNSKLLNVEGSPIHLSKTIMNLVSNASEAMPKGGRIQIRTENMYIERPIMGYDSVEEGDYVAVYVSDTGIGIADNEIGRIFEPFYTKKVMGRSGTGLGMAVVWGTIQDHKGYIRVESELKKGTTFKLYFPATRNEIKSDVQPKELIHYRGRGESILVVDDIREQREIALKILSQLGYSVETAASGEEAIEYLRDKTVDLIVLDMIMTPGIDGLETYRRIIARYPNQKTIIASGFSETNRVKEAQRLGAGKYLKKPYTIESIGLAIRSELDKEKKAA
jgi:PAS domain S-box-containing protein